MFEKKIAINVFSVTNEWIDFCVVIKEKEDYNKVLDIVENSYNQYWDEDNDNTVADYISSCLNTASIQHEIYFKDI